VWVAADHWPTFDWHVVTDLYPSVRIVEETKDEVVMCIEQDAAALRLPPDK
jgi:hypothetical protein